ncbi:phosphoglycerate kinase [Candidatus Desantisbacteria bacterium CG_4_10_14_0_8_um_filter_48_22]|uniref:Phosphoglycerate kinase n=1 Tax=Candidatus Desantisbacteria bacterium CG_4_10_14_0_8_um_filter_48_22 TaxID=1974543 RepID=A0A2M7SEM2_9BACT|nr:MAG: phosphoglycerate kinase [Candidatus Desantisbacteria bacterium CG1_02_49_89]PIV55369.1 MAG: phosphoglycerate kinase [Candidatus Desantisbacteria bacterium CG02_land_8_20_14_3_00_49_13]PIZ17985.1 MAG: phosphoglycerate kinase [Candidatus Desantisbacteria bacterium CG_4_10_14_0_8_um_filter_48_22]
MAKLGVEDLDMAGKNVLIRVDFNVTQDKEGKITDDTRIKASVQTIKYCVDKGAKVILMSHLGRPEGKVVESMRLTPVAKRLGELLGKKIAKTEDCVGPDAEKAVSAMKNGDVLLLENLRFHPEEENNAEDFSKKLAKLGDLYVNDAFGTAHRAHSSTVGVARLLPSAAGFLMKKEIEVLGKILEEPDKPFAAVLGGAKVSTKIGVIKNLLPRVSFLLIGGAMAYTFLKAIGEEVGNSKIEEDKLGLARDLILGDSESKIHLPIDHVVAKEIREGAQMEETGGRAIQNGWIGVDIGPKTVAEYRQVISKSKTVFWNGPMGIFEVDAFAKGTVEIAKAMAESGAVTVIGGGDSVSAAAKAGVSDKITHISTGGGASLELLEGITLPGIAALSEKK